MPKKIRLASKSRMECSIKTGSNVRKVANNTLSPGTKRRKTKTNAGLNPLNNELAGRIWEKN